MCKKVPKLVLVDYYFSDFFFFFFFLRSIFYIDKVSNLVLKDKVTAKLRLFLKTGAVNKDIKTKRKFL